MDERLSTRSHAANPSGIDVESVCGQFSPNAQQRSALKFFGQRYRRERFPKAADVFRRQGWNRQEQLAQRRPIVAEEHQLFIESMMAKAARLIQGQTLHSLLGIQALASL